MLMLFFLLAITALWVFPIHMGWAAEELRDIKPPLDLPFDYRFLVVIIIILLILIIIAALLYLNKNKAKGKPGIPKTADELALERILMLKAKNLPSLGKIKEYFSELSDILRRYIEDRFHLDAPEMTTQEFLETIKKSDTLRPQQKNLLKEFLNCCDMVKFAKYNPSTEEVEQGIPLVIQFVDETKIPKEVKGMNPQSKLWT